MKGQHGIANSGINETIAAIIQSCQSKEAGALWSRLFVCQNINSVKNVEYCYVAQNMCECITLFTLGFNMHLGRWEVDSANYMFKRPLTHFVI